MEKMNFRNQYDAALLAFSVLKRLKSGGVDTFAERMRSQKVQYLAQAFGVSPLYSFGLYIRGPYSSDLAYDLFKIRDEKIKTNEEEFVPEELEEKFNALKEFVTGKNLRELELVTTLHLLSRVDPKNALRKLESLKEPTPQEKEFAIKAVKQIP